jgi:hypothetical protein
VTSDQAKSKNVAPLRALKLEAEPAAALIGTAFMAVLLGFTAIYAGPLWRDEVNTINVALMPSLAEMWRNLPFESFPPLWPLLLRGAGCLGLADSDASIRILGLGVGLTFIGALWLSARWLGCRAPILSLALLGSLPAFIFIIGANRAYGLGSCLLVLSFGMIWRMLESPSRWRVLLAGITCLLFVHCVYYDVVFLAAMLAGGALVALRRQQGKTLTALVGIGGVSAASLLIYLPVIRRGSAYVPMMQWRYSMFATLWNRLGDTLTARSSSELGRNGPEIWLWIALLVGGTLVAVAALRVRAGDKSAPTATAGNGGRAWADRALFCVTSLVLGTFGMLAFLYRLHYPTTSWYYVEMLCLWTLSLDGLLGANWAALRPWGLLRIGFMVAVLSWGARSAWTEAHTRRSNMDLIATMIAKNAIPGDLIVVQSSWVGITFNRYYHGPVLWETIPPLDSHLVHRNDLMVESMQQLEPMVPVLRAITNSLQSGHRVWVVGELPASHPNPVPPNQPVTAYGRYVTYWSAQVSEMLLDHALHKENLNVLTGGPVCFLENPPLIRFAGYKPGPDLPTAAR